MSPVFPFPSGFLVIDKPEGWTSFDVIAKLRRLTSVSRIGHLGTLDPLATGVLVVAIGEGTKLIEYFMKSEKVYEVTAEVGKVSDTYDREGQITPVEVGLVIPTRVSGYSLDTRLNLHPPELVPELFSEEKLRKLLPEFCGDISQVPPAHSAIKIKGRPAYALARAGEKLDLAARTVHVHDIELLSCAASTFSLRVRCGSGTYIRSLVHDLGQRLGTGAFMTQLRRLSVGRFLLKNAVTLEISWEGLAAVITPLEKVVEGWPFLDLDESVYERIRHGQSVVAPSTFPSVSIGVPVAAFYQDRLVSIVTPDIDRIKVLKNLVLK